MEVTIERPEQAAVPIDRSGVALGLDEFSLLSRIQAGEINAVRARLGEMMIPESELERLAGGPVVVHPAQENSNGAFRQQLWAFNQGLEDSSATARAVLLRSPRLRWAFGRKRNYWVSRRSQRNFLPELGIRARILTGN